MRGLITADWHLVDKPSEEYRFGIFETIKKLVKIHKIDKIYLLGDLTHMKDGHRSEFVNRIVREFDALANHVEEIWILAGNHDYSASGTPFFKFLNLHRKITFISPGESLSDITGGVRLLMLPHTPDPVAAWKHPDIQAAMLDADHVFIHQPVDEAAHGGHLISSPLKASFFKKCKGKVIAGDIHCPQTIDNVVYVGSPHPTAFGENHDPRVFIYDSEKDAFTTVKLASMKKHVVVIHSVSELAEKGIVAGDHLRVRYMMAKRDASVWNQIRKQIKDEADNLGAKLFNTELVLAEVDVELSDHADASPKSRKDAVRSFGKIMKLSKSTISCGRRLVEGVESR